jgi:hypothetical protein
METTESVFVCPECLEESRHPGSVEFGYCDKCLAYTGAVNATLGGTTPYRINKGGLLRCCTGAMAAWVALHPGPWEKGTIVYCPHHQSYTAGGVIFDGSAWSWYRPEKDGKTDARP